MKKSTITLIIVILMLVAICIFAFAGEKKEETNEVEKNNKIVNSTLNEQENEKENEELKNNIEENTILENEVENMTSTETLEEEPKTAEEKAIEIVKKDWNGENVQFSVQGMDNSGQYIVTVTDSSTTQSLAFYSVNINDGTFKKREMI